LRITTVEQMLAKLDSAKIIYQLYQHPPVHTVIQAQQHCQHIPGAHVKNLCLCNKKKSFYCLVTLPDEQRIDLKKLSNDLGHGRLRFVNGEQLFDMLGVKPGAVNPFCLLNDTQRLFQFYIDRELQHSKMINVHPMNNNYTLHLKTQDLLSFLTQYIPVAIHFIDLA